MQNPIFNIQKSKEFISKVYYESVIPELKKFIEIENLSRKFDQKWATNGFLEQAAEHIKGWVEKLEIKGLKTEIIKHQGYTPLIFTQVAGQIDKTILLYGHFDKQPPFQGWDADKGPNKPVVQDGKLYGRGGADDGYSTYSSMLAVKAIQEQGFPLPRIVMVTEGDQQTGGHIEYYVQKLKDRIGNPEVIFCLDSGTIDYENLWTTTSLRGYMSGLLKVKTLTDGIHSGDASGVTPSAFRIANMLLGRLENLQTGQLHKKFQVQIPPNRYKQAYDLVSELGPESVKPYPFYGKTKPVSESKLELVLNRTWKAQLAIIGAQGLPEASKASNVMLPNCTVAVSIRCPPTLDTAKKIQELRQLLTNNPPYDAEVTFENPVNANGWNCPPLSSWLSNALDEAASIYFGKKHLSQGEGGSIPFLGLLAAFWPKAQFIVTGVLGPNSNAHGPNEFLHIDYTLKLTQAIAHVLARASEAK